MIFGSSKNKPDPLLEKIESLSYKLEEQKQNYESELKLLRKQLAAVVCGLAPSPEAILKGLSYSEVPKESLSYFIRNTPNLLILDVRADAGFLAGHLPGAKHIPAREVPQRLAELSHKSRPILTICANGNTALTVAQNLSKEGYEHVYNALSGMAGYQGPLEKSELIASDTQQIRGEDFELIQKVAKVMDEDIRPNLQKDGGDLQIVAVEEKIVKIKMVGACLGCGSQKRTVEDGIKNHLLKKIPELLGVEDLS